MSREVPKPYYIYELIDPRTDIPGYVGITNNPKVRHSQHLALRDGNIKKNSWVRRLVKEGVKPIIRILDTAPTKEQAASKERHWINSYLKAGVSLTNIRNSGDERPSLSLQSSFSFFKRLDYEWEEYQSTLERITQWKRSQESDMTGRIRQFTGTMRLWFPSKRNVISLWEEQKIQEY